MPQLKRSKCVIIGDPSSLEGINIDNLKMLEKYKRDMKMRELSEKSIYSYECDIKSWFRYVMLNQFNASVLELEEDDLEEYIFFCKEEGNNTERIKRRMSSISAFYKYLRRKKIANENPLEYIPRPKKGLPVVVQTFLTATQVEELKKELDKLDDLQMRTYVLLSLSTMARVTAISNIKWEQIDFDNRTIDDVLEKEGKIVTLYFSAEVRDVLKQLKEQRTMNNNTSPYVFMTRLNTKCDDDVLRAWTKKVGELIGVPELHPHDFRHSGATLLKNAGMPLEDISTLLNHGSTDVTRKHYIKEDKSKIGKNKDKFEI